MTNNRGNSVGVAGMLLFIIFVISMIMLSSCGSMRLTSAEQMHRASIDKQLNTLWNEYSYKVDSLTIEYYKYKDDTEHTWKGDNGIKFKE